MRARWSQRIRNDKKGKYAIVSGVAYHSLVDGPNPITKITGDLSNKNSWAHDPAFRLSTHDIDQLDGAEGAPLCVEHNRNDIVGHVHHSYIDQDDPKKGWRIMARLNLETDRGKQVFQDIQQGRLNGFSVGLTNDMNTNYKTGERHISGRNFHEISLVDQPFYDGCDLSIALKAGKNNQGKNYRNNSGNLHINI